MRKEILDKVSWERRKEGELDVEKRGCSSLSPRYCCYSSTRQSIDLYEHYYYRAFEFISFHLKSSLG